MPKGTKENVAQKAAEFGLKGTEEAKKIPEQKIPEQKIPEQKIPKPVRTRVKLREKRKLALSCTSQAQLPRYRLQFSQLWPVKSLHALQNIIIKLREKTLLR